MPVRLMSSGGISWGEGGSPGAVGSESITTISGGGGAASGTMGASWGGGASSGTMGASWGGGASGTIAGGG